ncbi:nucleotidyltransferase domain-containing protein [Mycobacterium kansasii]
MRTSALLPILRSQLQGGLLAQLYLHPESEYSLSEVAKYVGASVTAVHHEVERLVAAGLVDERRYGNMRLIRAAQSRLTRPLTELLALTYGPIAVLPDELAAVPGIRQAYLFGSWARRYGGEPGPPPGDVDVLVVGNTDLDDLDEAARRVEKILQLPVHIVRILPERWDSPAWDDTFVADVRSKPKVLIAVRDTE